jgi:hypothetical protein
MARPQLVFDEEMNHINALVESARSWTSFFKRYVLWLFGAVIVWSLAGFYFAGREVVSYSAAMSLTPFIDNVRILKSSAADQLNEVLLSDRILTRVLGSEQENGAIRNQLQEMSPDQPLTEQEMIHQLRSFLGLYRSKDKSVSSVTVVSPSLPFSTDLLKAFSAQLSTQFLDEPPVDYITFSATIRETIYDIAESLVVARNRISIFENANIAGQRSEEQTVALRQLLSDARMDSIFYKHLLSQYAQEKIDELHNPVPYVSDLIKGDIRYSESRPARNKKFLIVLIVGMGLTLLLLRARDLIRSSQAVA